MKIGVRAHDFLNGKVEGRHGVQGILEQIKKVGYETIQLAPAKVMKEIPSIHEITMDQIYILDEVLREVELSVSVLGCYIEPSLKDRTKRLSNVNTFQKNIAYAKVLGAHFVGTETTHFPMEDEDNRDRAYENLKDSMKRIAETAEKEGVDVAIEPVAVHTMNDPFITRRLIDEVGSEKIKVIFDPVNLIVPETVEKQDEIFQDVYRLLNEQMKIVHIKDFVVEQNDKKMTALGEGVVHLEGICSWLKENKPDITILREDAIPQVSGQDIAYLRNLFC